MMLYTKFWIGSYEPIDGTRRNRNRTISLHAGRTLDDAFVILDEAQNTTVAQMKMFLTRLGYQSK